MADFCFDEVLLVAQAIEDLINQGEDFTEFENMDRSLRSAFVNGATGSVSISPNSNDRPIVRYQIYNFQKNIGNSDSDTPWEIVGELCSFCDKI